MQIETEKKLQCFNTLAVPAIASHYIHVDSLQLLKKAISWAQQAEKKIYVLAGGSNVILPDYIEGLVIQPKIKGIEIIEQNANECIIQAGAGENWHAFVEHCVDQQLYGIENLALIPGDVGASPIQNIGAYGVELKDVFHYLDAYNCNTGEIERFDRASCQFAYRHSFFKTAPGQSYIICSVAYKLSRKAKVHLQYPAIKNILSGNDDPSPLDVMRAVIDIRRSKLPDPESVPNAGSFFKNPVIQLDLFDRLKTQFPDIVAFDVGSGRKKLAAAWLIEQAGWKGKEQNGVVIHASHALVLTNPHHCGSDAILAAVAAIQADVESLFGVHLELEPRVFA